jgi:hypothetical protein
MLVSTGEVITAGEISFSQTYTFRQDGSFVKLSTESGSDSQATGTFTTEEAEPNEQGRKHYLFLTFETGTELTTTCNPNRDIEDFSLFDNGRIINNSISCDLPSLTYQKRD